MRVRISNSKKSYYHSIQSSKIDDNNLSIEIESLSRSSAYVTLVPPKANQQKIATKESGIESDATLIVYSDIYSYVHICVYIAIIKSQPRYL